MIIKEGDITKTYLVAGRRHLTVYLTSGCINIVFVNEHDFRMIKTCNELGKCFDEDVTQYTYFTFESVAEAELTFSLT